MKSSFAKIQLEKLIPTLSKQEKQEIVAYYTVYEKYEAELSKQATKDLENHPVFGKLIRDIPKEVAAASSKVSRDLQKDAIINNNWQPYIEYQIQQGVTYAKMGLDFKSWYEVVALVRNYLSPYLNQEYGNGNKFLSALNGMNHFMDIAMGIIGEAYMRQKEEIIQQDQEQINKLNEELEQKVIERTAQLKESEEKYHTLFNSIDEGYCIIEMIFNEQKKPIDYRFLEINASFEKQTGLHDAVGKRMREFAPNHEEHWFEIYGKIALTGESVRFENRAEQLHRWYDVYAFRFGEPKNLQVAILFNDISERKKTEEQLKGVNKELEAFTYSVSHDLRAPLRAVNGYAEILNEDYETKLDEEGKHIIETIRYNAIKMGTLIDDLLAFSKLGRKEVQRAKINMNELVEGVFIDLAKSFTHKAEIKIGKLHPLEADYGLMHQVMFNLISNAIKYSSKKEHPLVEIFSEQKNDEVIFSVKDNGAGFDMKYYDKLFGVFQRLHAQEEFDGVGVGLAIIQRIIAKHGGKVWAEGKVNEGAQFNFSVTTN
ncbi:MAG: sensor histidine kinase [Bacteroidia bacterium]